MTASPPTLIARPLLPEADRLLPYLRRIDASRWYTNGGTLIREFEARLAAHFTPPGGPVAHVAAVTSATTGLTLALQAMGTANGRRCLLPSWTFGASACAVQASGLTPHFVDVTEPGWMPDPGNVAAMLNRHADTAALLLVPPAGALADLAGWEALATRHRAGLVVDLADGFDILRPMAAPQVVSLHACKAFGIGEGGCVVSTDSALIARIRRLTNFGIGTDRVAEEAGINGKLSEYSAAVGLAALDSWPETRARWLERAAAYRRLLHERGHALLFQRGHACATALVDLGAPVARDVVAAMRDAHVETRRWWGDGCHAQPAFAPFPAEALPVTASLASRILGLPFHVDLDDARMAALADMLTAARERCRATAQ